jgi:hypothetical protein
MRWTRRLALSTGLAVAAVGIAVPLSLSTATASATATDPAAAVTQVQDGKLPQALKDDLKAAWAAPDGQRVAALQAVLQKAVAGDYGSAVQQRAQRLSRMLSKMDPALKADLQAAIELPKDQRQAAFKDIRHKIRSGDYGDQVKRNAKILRRLMRLHRLGG